jgi:nucleotide-binding universal stress UspA family protein
MDSKTKSILVTWDFSEKSEYAFAHAVNISKITKNDITLIHIVNSEKEIEQATGKLTDEAVKMHQKFGLQPKVLALKGSIFKTISHYASQGNTEMVIMGTHGIKGLQKVTGSFALKVIRGSKVPFLVVQDMPASETMNNIVFPIDFKKENKEKIKWAHYLCNLYHSKIHIIHPRVTDKLFKSRIYSNIIFTKKYFDNTDIVFEINTIGNKATFAKETIDFAQKVNANLILIMTSRNITFADYIMGPSEQYIIANESKIPVMVINPKPRSMAGGFSATGN